MINRLAIFTGMAALVLAGCVVAAEALESGPQPGAKVAAFEPLNVTGEAAGKNRCQVCKNGSNPVAMIFAREVSTPLANLVKKVDEATAHHSAAKLGSFVVLCNDDDIKGLEKQLKELAEKNQIEHTVLTIDDANGPEGYKISKDADITVVLYVNRTVKVNRAFKKGEMTQKDIDEVTQDLSKILPVE